MRYFSQTKQDEIVDRLTKCKEKGVFVDIGAHDGITYSNTFFFEKFRGWSGVCVEPVPEIFAKLKMNRKCILINGAISNSNKIVDFKRVYGERLEMLSGILENQDESHSERIEHHVNKNESKYEIIKMQTYTITNVLQEHNLLEIDYVSIDVEGAELEVLSSFDFDKIKVNYITVENNNKDQKISNFLSKSGFIFAFHYGADEFHIRKDLYKKSLFFDRILLPIWLISPLKLFIIHKIPLIQRIYRKFRIKG